MNNKVFIRADGNAEIGLGHLIRCKALAHMLKEEFSISFFLKEIPSSLLKEITTAGFEVNQIETEEKFLQSLTGNEIVVLDHYELLNLNYQRTIKNIGSKLVCIDDLHNTEFYADLIINHSPGITISDYHAQPYTNFALGPGFSLLRPSFLRAAVNPKEITVVDNLMVCFGGSDFQNLTKKVLDVVNEIDRFKKINVVLGASYPYRDSLNEIPDKNNKIQIFESLNELEILSVIRSSNVSIVPASGILLETIAGGSLPFICYYADNQKELFNYFHRNDMLPTFDAINFDRKKFKQELKNLVINDHLSKISLLRKEIGNASKNISFKFKEILQPKLREVSESDCLKLFQWVNEEEAVLNSLTQEPVPWEDHVNWFNNKLISQSTKIFILENKNAALGQIRFDFKNNYWEISFSIDKQYRGKGYGKLIIEEGLKKISGPVRAIVKKKNIPSIKVFKNLGFQKSSLNNDLIEYIFLK